MDVTIVGADTFGKPVGQIGLEFCDQILRPTSFQTLNADDFGDYFDGLPVDCAAADDLNEAVGADTDPNVVAALAIPGRPAPARSRCSRVVSSKSPSACSCPSVSWIVAVRRTGSLPTRFEPQLVCM